MKYRLQKIVFIAAASLMPLAGYADYTPLEPLPGLNYGSNVQLPALLNALFDILLQLGAGLAVVMLAVGGFQYMTSEALHGKEKGRERITNALLGLLLLLGTYLILFTVNPALLNFNLNIERATGAAVTPAASTNASPGFVPPVSGGTTGRSIDANTQVTYTNPDGSVVGIDKSDPSCQRRVNAVTALGKTVQGQCN